MKVKEIMSRKVNLIHKETTIGEIARMFMEQRTSGFPVVSDSGEVVGIVTQKDLLYKDMEPRSPAVVEILGGLIYLDGGVRFNEELKKATALRAEDIMSREIISVGSDEELGDAVRLMLEKDVSRLPVVNEGKLEGMLGTEDIIRHIADNLG